MHHPSHLVEVVDPKRFLSQEVALYTELVSLWWNGAKMHQLQEVRREQESQPLHDAILCCSQLPLSIVWTCMQYFVPSQYLILKSIIDLLPSLQYVDWVFTLIYDTTNVLLVQRKCKYISRKARNRSVDYLKYSNNNRMKRFSQRLYCSKNFF